MNAYEIPNLRFSLPAGAAISRRRFVTANASSAGVYATADATVIGVSMNETKIGEVLEIADGIVLVEASAAIAAGSNVSVAVDGKAKVAAAGEVVGIAITAATGAGIPVAVKLI